MSDVTKPRGIISILLIGIFLGPFALMLWLGRGKAALVYAFLSIAALIGVVFLFVSYTITPVTIAPLLWTDAISLSPLSLAIIGLGHAFWIRRESLSRPWYSRWFIAPAFILAALVVAGSVRTFLYQPFDIRSGAMAPNLLVGDYFFVSKTAYGYSQFSFPLGIAGFSGRFFGASPQRGDLAVFKLPRDNETDYIKRVIGLPGDRIQMKDGVLRINGVAVRKEQVGDYDNSDGKAFPGYPKIPMFRETLPNGVSYLVIDVNPAGDADNTEEYVVPPGHFFVLGDNRDNSQDSRYLSVVGYIPEENFIGPAVLIFWNDLGLSLTGRPGGIAESK